VALGTRHLPRSGVPRDLLRIGHAFVVRAIRPWAWQLPVFVTMLGARFHTPNATAPGRPPFTFTFAEIIASFLTLAEGAR
jgi:hypothetical protein